jgi:hypothetical protein
VDDHWRLAWGIARSLWIYYRSPGRRRRMDRLYSRFVVPGDLVFDIGAHVGDRTAAFCRLGCRVVAVEPQPPLVGLLRKFYGHSAKVMIAPVAVAASPGNIELLINSAKSDVDDRLADLCRLCRACPRLVPRTLGKAPPGAGGDP